VSALIFGPAIAKSYINKNGKKLIIRNLYLEKIRVNYATFTIRLIGFKLFEKDDSMVFTGFDPLLVVLQPLKLLKSELAIKRLWLIDPVASITKTDTVFNYSDTLLSENNTRKLDQLLQIKAKKHELTVDLAYFNDRAMEKEQVGLEEAGRIFLQQTGGDYTAQRSEFEDFLKRILAKTQSIFTMIASCWLVSKKQIQLSGTGTIYVSDLLKII
jgi:hypothetical protein